PLSAISKNRSSAMIDVFFVMLAINDSFLRQTRISLLNQNFIKKATPLMFQGSRLSLSFIPFEDE
ncbi:MAG TPA: hypothetical protein DCY39_04675, partial [Exiguobacterium sp.]|nr:hypothetical protein [Exiguobacterium sp.]